MAADVNDTKQEQINRLEEDLQDLRYELDDNQLEQEELRGLARGLEERIAEIENEIDALESDFEDEENTVANEACICGFLESQHLGPLVLRDIETPGDIEIAIRELQRREAYFLEFSLMHGKAPCDEFKRDNLKYLERISDAK